MQTFNLYFLGFEKSFPFRMEGLTDLTDPNYRKASLLIIRYLLISYLLCLVILFVYQSQLRMRFFL